MTVRLKSKLERIAVYEFVTSFKESETYIDFTIQRFKDDIVHKELLVESVAEYTLYRDSGEEIETRVFNDEPTNNTNQNK